VKPLALGLDYGTNSVRALLACVETGEEVGEAVWNYRRGERGVVVDARRPELARQHPRDYLEGLRAAIRAALGVARKKGAASEDVIGIGVDATGSTPIPVDRSGEPLALNKEFEREPDAMAWLWKDHVAHAEAVEITARARAEKPEYLSKYGGVYSSEWFWSKLLHARRFAPRVWAAAHTWVELADWIPAVLTGTTDPAQLRRGICAAGHKAMFHPSWGGYPAADFLAKLDPDLVRVRATLPDRAWPVGEAAGALTPAWARALGLPAGLPVSVGAFDAHLGAVGSGIRPGVLVKIIGTSACDIAVAPLSAPLPDIPGICGIVPESVRPGLYGIEAGQSAVGDIFHWFVEGVRPGGSRAGSHEALTREAERLRPGESGLLALDWWNGNRTVLMDQRLSGLVVGLTLGTTSAEIYRALIEATAFGARAIMERLEEYGVPIRRVVACGGIAVKNPLAMRIYADVLNRPVEISRSAQTCALGAAMAGSVVAGRRRGGHANFAAAERAMTGVRPERFMPDRHRVATYARLYPIYRTLHDGFGLGGARNLGGVMKELLSLRDEVRHGIR
jgi:L-ribulokinase